MSTYVDSSAQLKRYVDETDSADADALHLAAAQRISAPGVGFLTFDLRQAQAARTIGLIVLTA